VAIGNATAPCTCIAMQEYVPGGRAALSFPLVNKSWFKKIHRRYRTFHGYGDIVAQLIVKFEFVKHELHNCNRSAGVWI
jgi:hypothetical protein